MKVRNIGFFEQHGEKIALGVTGLVLLAAAYHYVLGSPNTVTISGQTATPETVDQVIYAEAERLQRELREGTPAELAEIVVPSYRNDFEFRRSEPLLAETRLAGALGSPPLFEGDDPVPGTRFAFHVPEIPAVPIVAARSDVGTVEEFELDDNFHLAQFFEQRGKAESPDLAWISLVGQFDMRAMIRELGYAEEGVSRRVPESWWINDLALVDVHVERQELQADGSWSSAERVESLPGMRRHDVQDPVESEEAIEIVEAMHDEQIDVVQRPFFSLVNRTWSPPDPDAQDMDLELDRIAELRQSIEDEERRLDAALRHLENQEQRASRQQQQPQRPRGGETRGRGGTPPSPEDYYTEAPRQQQQPRNRSNRSLERAQERVERHEENLYEYQVELAELTGQDPPRRPTRSQRRTAGPGGPGMIDPSGRGQQQRGRGGSSFSEQDYARQYEEMYMDVDPRGGLTGPGRGAQQRRGGRQQQFRRGQISEDLDDELRVYRSNHLGAIPLQYVKERYLDVWAHDVHVEEGKTYRYRLRVGVLNPFYGRGNSLLEDQQGLEDQFLLYSDWSDWTEPQQVEPLHHFFFVDGSRSPSPGHVTAEVWRFTQGSWFHRDFRVVPGDPIGHVAEAEDEFGELEVDFFTNAYVVDVDFDHPVPGAGPVARTTPRVVYAVEYGEQPGDVAERMVALDRDETKRTWLQLQQERLAGGLSMR